MDYDLYTGEKKDGCYTRLFYALGLKWDDYISNEKLYGKLHSVSSRLLEKQLIFAVHCVRSNQPVISDLVFWDHTKWRDASSAHLLRKQRQATASCEVDGFVVSDHELVERMKDRNEWRLRIRAII